MTVDELAEAVFMLPPSEKKAVLRTALASAHAEGLEAAARVCDEEDQAYREGRSMDMASLAASRIRSLIPAAPEVKDE